MLSYPGSVSNFLKPKLQIPEPKQEEIAKIKGTKSCAVYSQIGLDVLGSFFSSFGFGNLTPQINTVYESSDVSFLKFKFHSAVYY